MAPANSPRCSLYHRPHYARFLFYLERFFLRYLYRVPREQLFSVDPAWFGVDVARNPGFRENAADGIFLHWVNQGYISLKGLRKLATSDPSRPVVWVLHDMWPVTGICHIPGKCDRWKQGCTQCPLHPSLQRLARDTYRRKAEIYAAAPNLTFVACSQWLATLAAQSPLTKGHRVIAIPNSIDTGYYNCGTPYAQRMAAAQKSLRIPPRNPDSVYFLFTAYNLLDEQKGWKVLEAALKALNAQRPQLAQRAKLLLAGKNANELAARLSTAIECFPLGYLSTEEQMREAYSAVHYLLMPTLADNLPNTIMEAFACGVPVIASRVGGIPEMVTNGHNGYLFPVGCPEALSECIMRAVTPGEGDRPYDGLRNAARDTACRLYSPGQVAKRWMSEVFQAGQDHHTP